VVQSDPVLLEIYKNLLSAVAEEMGVVLRRSAFSPNIKERRDFSCAVFNAEGLMVAQAAHIPVHLGSMPLSVAAAVERFPGLTRGDMVVLNDPYRGGTHLPDITLVSPVFHASQDRPSGYVASRAHHADVGGISPGSMPVASEIFQEGLIIPPVRLVRGGEIQQEILELLLANVRTPEERLGDIAAQIAANQRGVQRLGEILERYKSQEVSGIMQAMLVYTERMTRRMLATLPDGVYRFGDVLDDDGIGAQPVPLEVTLTIQGDEATIDFTGSARQQAGNLNAVLAITYSAVFYVIRCLLEPDVPNNAGVLAPVRVIAPPGSVVNCLPPAAVAGGNVETSQRIVDVLLGALAKACPARIPAASQGTMNNITLGGWDPRSERPFTYYETIGGGMGARPDRPGVPAIHTHMTNTLNTPVEALEYAYPLRVRRYEIRLGSGGRGRFTGGDGIRRDLQALAGCQVTLLTERRRTQPYGLEGGEPGSSGENIILRDGETIVLPGKGAFQLHPGDVLSIRTPGGGGYGALEQPGDSKDDQHSPGSVDAARQAENSLGGSDPAVTP
jgi:N-methylhydantoinase B